MKNEHIIELRVRARAPYSINHLETLGEELKDLIYDECGWVEDVTYEIKTIDSSNPVLPTDNK